MNIHELYEKYANPNTHNQKVFMLECNFETAIKEYTQSIIKLIDEMIEERGLEGDQVELALLKLKQKIESL